MKDELSYLAWDKQKGVACKQRHKYWVNKNLKLPSPVNSALFSEGGKCPHCRAFVAHIYLSIYLIYLSTKSPLWGRENTANISRTG